MKIALVVVLLCLAMVKTGIARSFPHSTFHQARASGRDLHKILSPAKSLAPIPPVQACTDEEIKQRLFATLDRECISAINVLINPDSTDAEINAAFKMFCIKNCDGPTAIILVSCGKSADADYLKAECRSQRSGW